MTNTKKKTAPVQKREEPKKRSFSPKLWIPIFAGTALLLAAAILLLIFKPFAFNLFTTDLSRYVTLPADAAAMTVDVRIDPVRDEDVERQIMALRVSSRTANAEAGGLYYTDRALTWGDDAYIYYCGHYVDDGGETVYLASMCNITNSSPTQLGIGSANFIPGFESGLVGKSPADCSQIEKITTGEIAAGDVVYLSYVYFKGDGYTQVSTRRILLDDRTAVDAAYGEGFYDYLIGKSVTFSGGQYVVSSGDFSGGVYYNLSVDTVTHGEETPVSVETYFPYDYKEESLRQLTVTFDVYIVKTQIYDIPEYTDAFVSDTLGYSADTLADYAGDTLTEKFTSFVRTRLQSNLDSDRTSLLEDAIWEYLLAETKLIRYPEKRVAERKNQYILELNTAFGNQTTYTDIDTYASYYYSIPTGQTYQAYFEEQAKESVFQEMIFYALARKLDALPDEQTLSDLAEDILDSYVAGYASQYSIVRSNYATDEAYLAALTELKTQVARYYGSAYFEEEARYEYVFSRIVKCATVHEISPLNKQ